MLVFDRVSALGDQARVRELPAIECCLAAWAARAPEREPMERMARKIQALMPLELQDLAAELDERLTGWPLRALNAFYRTGLDDFEESLAQLRSEDPNEVALDLLLGAVSRFLRVPRDGGEPLAAALSSGYVSEHAQRRMTWLTSRPAESVSAVLDVLEGFWQAGFAEAWQGQRDCLESRATALAAQMREGGLRPLAGISPRGLFDSDADRLVFLGGQGTKLVPCDELEAIDVVPSLWLRRRVVAAYGLGRVAIAIGWGAPRTEQLPADQLPRVLAALGDERRLEILRLCIARSRSTKELAEILGITEGPVSRHLKVLARHRLVVGQRFGREVTYAAVPEVMDLVGRRLQHLYREQSEWRAIPAPAGALGL